MSGVGRAPSLRETSLERAQRYRQCRKVLIHAVMQRAGNAPALLLLGGHQPPGQVPDVFRALVRHALGALSRQRVGEDVGEQTEPRNHLVRPAALRKNRTDRQAADHRAAVDEGDRSGRPRAEPCEAPHGRSGPRRADSRTAGYGRHEP